MKSKDKYQFVLILILLAISMTGKAALPDFRIALIDSSYFSCKNLNNDQPTLFIYFSPACDECSTFTTCLIDLEEELSTLQVVMITNESFQSVKRFVSQYHLNKYKNIVVGTEGLTGNFLQNNPVQKLPYAVFYNKHGIYIQEYDNSVPVKEFLKQCLK